MQIDQKTPLVFIDLETTGTSPRTSHIIEIGIVRVEGGVVVKEYRTLINPNVLVPEFVSSLTGITNAMLVGAPTFSDVVSDVLECLKGGLFVAHNAPFDYGFLERECGRLGVLFSYPYLCTTKLSRALYPSHDRHNLDSIIERFSINPGSRHRALDDARVLWDFTQVVYREFGTAYVHSVMNNHIRVRRVSAAVSQSVIDALPERPGIYVLYGKNKEVIFIGKSRRIRTRVRAHCSRDGRLGYGVDLFPDVYHVEYQETVGEIGALLLESHLIRTLQSTNVMVDDSCVVVCEQSNVAGYNTLSLTHADTISPKDTNVIMSVFPDREHTLAALQSAAEEHKLCRTLIGIENSTPCSGVASGQCKGACTQGERPRHYNKRFKEAFDLFRIKKWPFSGPVAIEERRPDGTGELFIFDTWCLIAALQHCDGVWGEFVPARYTFDYDVYKLLARELSKRKAKLSVRTLTVNETTLLCREHSVSGDVART